MHRRIIYDKLLFSRYLYQRVVFLVLVYPFFFLTDVWFRAAIIITEFHVLMACVCPDLLEVLLIRDQSIIEAG